MRTRIELELSAVNHDSATVAHQVMSALINYGIHGRGIVVHRVEVEEMDA